MELLAIDPTCRAHVHVEAGGVGVGVDREAGHGQRPSAADGVRQQRAADSDQLMQRLLTLRFDLRMVGHC